MLPSFPHKGGSSSTDSLPRLPLHIAGTAGASSEAQSNAPPSPLRGQYHHEEVFCFIWIVRVVWFHGPGFTHTFPSA
jgi:hypothetical protein